jgi:glycosyltransferase involved in cell wall biosynthesis
LKPARKLKVVGTGPEEARFKKLAEGAPWIEFMGRVSDEELQHLYSHTKAFIFAAEEDAGIVPVEAMACGKPVIAYKKGGVTDVLVDGVHGLYYNDQTVDSLIDALERFESATFDPKLIRKHAESYATDVFKEKLRKIIEK